MRTAALEADYDTFADALQDEGLSFNMAGNQDAVRDELRRIQLLILRRIPGSRIEGIIASCFS
jgi:hypothetical protein